jgi:uncharacterized membrane-anchored protein YhcB (DUF1043 family)
MNRDVTDWIYASEGFAAGLIIVGYILQMLATRFH